MRDKPYKSEDLEPISGFPKGSDFVFLAFLIFIIIYPSYLPHIHKWICKLFCIYEVIVNKSGSNLFVYKISFSILIFIILTITTTLIIKAISEFYKKILTDKKTLNLYIINGNNGEYIEPSNDKKYNKNEKTPEESEVKIFELVLETKKLNNSPDNCKFSERLIFRLFGSTSCESKPLEYFLKDNFNSLKYFLSLVDPFLFALSFREIFYIFLIGVSINNHNFVFSLSFETFFILSVLKKVYTAEKETRKIFYFFDSIYFYLRSKSFDTFFDEGFLYLLNKYKEKATEGKLLFSEIIKQVLGFNH